ncbi:universal stress protein [Cochlodiniinecator piscidefendens]|uniref:universal stress protein n=1 Tax=Cochlodiniinecator piscidefendens TaxID=2715756 RepID=UPI00140C091D|nr:universal stress protein [Cochlodiniinecator piscidefendens]
MGFKTILNIVTDADVSAPPLERALAISKVEDAHLDVMCLGIDRTQTGYYYAGANALVQQETLIRAREEAETLETSIRQRLSTETVAWSVESGVAQLAGLARIIAHRARFADLVVLPKPYGKSRGQEIEAIVEAAMFEGHAPVLVVPDSCEAATIPRRVVVAWNESTEALSAIRAALPALRAAEEVNIAIIDPPTHSPDRSDPGGALSQMLVRHGVKAEISVLAKTMPRVSDVLLRHARDIDADLMVMGAYGHSRFREAILGGATRNMLEHAEVPVLMAH